MNMHVRSRIVLLVAAAVAASITGRADAALVVTLEDGVGGITTVVDNGIGDMDVNVGGIVLTNFSMGNATAQIAAALSSSPTPLLTLSVNGISTTGPGQLIITATDDSFTSDGISFQSDLTTSIDSTGLIVEASQIIDELTILQHSTFGQGVNAETFNQEAPHGNPFSITERIVFTFEGATSSNQNDVDVRSKVIPAPAALPAGVALMGLLAMIRRRRPE